MSVQNKIVYFVSLYFMLSGFFYSEEALSFEVGETLRINTYLHAFVGRPSWLIVIKDLDHERVLPYLFDITKPTQFFLVLTAGKNYKILASTLKINTYGALRNRYQQATFHDFCHLENGGRIYTNTSFYISLSGNLTLKENTVNCRVTPLISR